MAAGELALGVAIKGSPHIIATLAKSGFDFVRPDMMFSGIDWRELEHMIRAAKAEGITSWVRIPSNPWFGGDGNLQVAVDAARAFSLGVEVVQVSIASAAQVEALLSVAKDWHRSAAGSIPSSLADLTAQVKRVSSETMFIPSIECKSAMENIDDILSIKGLRAIYVAMTDFSEQLGHPFDCEHPEVWAAYDRIARNARARGITLVTNTGFPCGTREANIRRVRQLHDHGTQVVMTQNVEYLMQEHLSDVVKGIRDEIKRG